MKKMKTFSMLVATAALAVASIATGVAQTNLGSSCGCPDVNSRPRVLMSQYLRGTVGDTLGGNKWRALQMEPTTLHLTCDKTWILDTKFYVGQGQSITIDPGTLIKGIYQSVPSNATGLFIARGGQCFAEGTEECPIVMTGDVDPMDGSFALTNVGTWGGLVIMGTAFNNLDLAHNSQTLGSGHLCVGHDGVGYIEGFDVGNGLNLFGAGDAAFPTVNNHDNSGIFRYVSVRHAGAIIDIGNELNGISMGSVGDGTTFDHVEVISAADDNIEYFGGTVNVKYISTLFGDDDMFDWDLGYSGKCQFYFGISADTLTAYRRTNDNGTQLGNMGTTDNGFEMDADDNNGATATSNHSYPQCWNVTMISNGHLNPVADNTGPAAIQAKELTSGTICNSVFANWRCGLHLSELRSTSALKGDAYDQWTNDMTDPYLVANGGIAQPKSLIVKYNTFIACGDRHNVNAVRYPISRGHMFTGKNPAHFAYMGIPTTADTTQFYQTDHNNAVASVPGIVFNYSFDTNDGLNANAGFTSTSQSNSTITSPFHCTPLTNIPSDIAAPNDGFFTPVHFQGAFDANSPSWISKWTQVQVASMQNANPTDINGDGVTDINDFNIFIGRFNQQDN